MRRAFHVVSVFLLTVSLASGAEQKKNCYPITANDLFRKDAPTFYDYPAVIEKIAKPAKINLKSNPAARNWRTALREGSKSGPRFAGHYAVASWGCGSGCIEFGLVDLKTGKVFFPDGITPITVSPLVDADDFEASARPEDERVFRCKADSRLLIVVGSIEDEFASKERSGAFYYVLENDKLKKIYETKVRKNDCFDDQDGSRAE